MAEGGGDEMRKALLRTRKGRIVLLIGSLCLVSLVAVCSHWRIWGYGDLSLYLRLRYHSPVAGALWRGEIQAGDRIDRVIAMSRPNFRRDLGSFIRIDYYPTGDLSPGNISLEGTSLTAKDGRLIAAGSYGCTFQRTFFDVSTAEENGLYERLHEERITGTCGSRRRGVIIRLNRRVAGPTVVSRCGETASVHAIHGDFTHGQLWGGQQPALRPAGASEWAD
jgi:hypothetical protein